MTFDAFESSVEQSQPVETFRFTLGTQEFRFTSAEDPIIIGSDQFLPEAISRGRLSAGREEDGVILEISVPATNPFAVQYVGVVPGLRAKCVIQRIQRLDGSAPQVITVFTGFVQSVRFTEQGKLATVAVLPTVSALSRPMPRFSYASLCNHVLYDARCKVDENDPTFRLDNALVTAISGNTITVTGAGARGADFWVGGFVATIGTQDFRLVLHQNGDDLDMMLPFPFNIVGQNVNVLAGCNHTIAVCDSKFFTPEDVNSNVINFGGHAFVPTRNPFKGGLV